MWLLQLLSISDLICRGSEHLGLPPCINYLNDSLNIGNFFPDCIMAQRVLISNRGYVDFAVNWGKASLPRSFGTQALLLIAN